MIFDNDDFLERVAYIIKRTRLLKFFFPVGDKEGRLYIISFAAKVGNKIHFKLGAKPLAILVLLFNLHHSNIYVVATYNQLIIYDILHNMRFLLLTHIQDGIP